MPALVVIDPRTVAAVPPQVLLSTGMIALTQAMAGLLGTAANPMVETYAQAATGYIVENLGVAIEHPHAGSERIAVASGAAVAGAVRANMDAGIVYPLARLLGSVCDTAVGILAGILLPHSFTLNRFKQQALDQLLLPLAGFDAFARTPPGKRLSGAVEYVRDFQQQMFGLAGRNIPATLRDTGLSRDLLEDVSAQVMANSENKDDCRDCLTILEKAW